METNSIRSIPQETSTTDVAHFRYGSRICRYRALYASASRPNELYAFVSVTDVRELKVVGNELLRDIVCI